MKVRCTVDGKPEGVVEDESEMLIMNRDQKNRNLLTSKKTIWTGLPFLHPKYSNLQIGKDYVKAHGAEFEK